MENDSVFNISASKINDETMIYRNTIVKSEKEDPRTGIKINKKIIYNMEEEADEVRD